jgi:CDP-glucose 4,6-dehydratase
MVDMFKNRFKGKKVLITGNTGFKGSWLSLWLINLGAKVYGVSKDIPSNPALFDELKLDAISNHYYEDVRDFEKLKSLICSIEPDYIFHMAAQPIVVDSYLNPLETLSSNIMGTANILESLRVINKKCVCVIITSDKCYENVEQVWGYKENDKLGGKDIYSCSKASAEIVVNSYYNSFFKNSTNIRIATARAGNVIGGGDWAKYRIVPDCIRAWKDNDIVSIRNPESTRPWQHVLEPLSGYLHLASLLGEDIRLNGESFNFGPLSINNKTVEELLVGLSSYWDLKANAFEVEKSNLDFHEAGLLQLNCDKSLHYLDWNPNLSFNDLVEFTSEWYYNYYVDKKDIFDFTLNQINEFQNKAKTKNYVWTNEA